MEKTNFADSERYVSKLCFGGWGLSGVFENCSEKDSIKAIINCLDKGINFIDTARDYGDSEHMIGKALKIYGGEKPFISQKSNQKVLANCVGECLGMSMKFSRKAGSQKVQKRVFGN